MLSTFALLLLSSPALAQLLDLPDAAPPPCDITVSFRSMGQGGTDKDTGMSMRAYLAGMADTLSYTQTRWGRDGEYDYCINVNNANERASIYRQLRGLLPIDNSISPPIMIKAHHLKAATIDEINAPVPPLPDDH